ncbi:hypothetical protein [Kitasatospora sp. NPDC088346]|uniref:hypothetical protein n=1 Tax=Kitasatospora sp. NPDC088346 TaxID=3364073 RepID=UPI00381CEEA4
MDGLGGVLERAAEDGDVVDGWLQGLAGNQVLPVEVLARLLESDELPMPSFWLKYRTLDAAATELLVASPRIQHRLDAAENATADPGPEGPADRRRQREAARRGAGATAGADGGAAGDAPGPGGADEGRRLEPAVAPGWLELVLAGDRGDRLRGTVGDGRDRPEPWTPGPGGFVMMGT